MINIHKDYQNIVLSFCCLLLYLHLYLLEKIINKNIYLIENENTKNIWLKICKILDYIKYILIFMCIYFYILSYYDSIKV